jgi:hypothetical protein
MQHLAAEAQHISHQREVLRLLDPKRQLQRGWSLTRDAQGKLVRSSARLQPGEQLVTTFAEGSATSIIDEIRSPACAEAESPGAGTWPSDEEAQAVTQEDHNGTTPDYGGTI